jgi:RNA polymerase sigma factor (sigma-70 family)
MESYPNTQEILQDVYRTEEFLEENKALVISIIKRKFNYILYTYEREDYIQEGLISLYKAMKHYTSEKGKWSTYAYSYIYRSLLYLKQPVENKMKIYNKNIKSLSKNNVELYGKVNVEEQVVNKLDKEEKIENMIKKMNTKLKPKGKIILGKILKLKPRKEIAKEMKVTTQCIDDHIQTIKKYAKLINQGA